MLDIVEWTKKELGIPLTSWQEEFLRKSYEGYRRGERLIIRKKVNAYRYIPARAGGKSIMVTIIDDLERRVNEESQDIRGRVRVRSSRKKGQ